MLEILSLIEIRPLCGVYETRIRQAVKLWHENHARLSVERLRFHVKLFAADYSREHPLSASTVFKQSPDNFFHFKVERRLIVILSLHWPYYFFFKINLHATVGVHYFTRQKKR